MVLYVWCVVVSGLLPETSTDMQIESLAADDAFNGDNNADDVDDAHMSGSDDAGGDDITEKMDDESAALEKDQPVRQFVPILQSRPYSLSWL